jgi:hypothetical protein
MESPARRGANTDLAAPPEGGATPPVPAVPRQPPRTSTHPRGRADVRGDQLRQSARYRDGCNMIEKLPRHRSQPALDASSTYRETSHNEDPYRFSTSRPHLRGEIRCEGNATARQPAATAPEGTVPTGQSPTRNRAPIANHHDAKQPATSPDANHQAPAVPPTPPFRRTGASTTTTNADVRYGRCAASCQRQMARQPTQAPNQSPQQHCLPRAGNQQQRKRQPGTRRPQCSNRQQNDEVTSQQ